MDAYPFTTWFICHCHVHCQNFMTVSNFNIIDIYNILEMGSARDSKSPYKSTRAFQRSQGMWIEPLNSEMGVSRNGGTTENPKKKILKWMIWGDPHFRKAHLLVHPVTPTSLPQAVPARDSRNRSHRSTFPSKSVT